MGIKPGYKQTDVGVLPTDWEVKSLGELFSVSGGFSASWEQLSNEGFCYLHYGDIHKSTKNYIDVKIEYSKIPKLKIPIKKVSLKSLLNDGNVVFVDASEDDEGASKHLVIRNPEGIPYISGLHTIVLKSKDNSFDNKFKQYCFQTSEIRKQFKYYAVGTKVTGISKTNIASVLIPRPPKTEQTAIANVLSDTDALIDSLEKLLAKKRLIKQGAMQELLTGKKRLPGFGGEWEEEFLAELADNKKELFDDGDWIEAEYLTEAGIRLIQTGNIGVGVFLDKENKKYISQKSFVTLRCKEIREGDILICRLAEPAGRACIMPNIGEDKIITSVDVSIFRPLITKANRQYLVNVLSTNNWFNLVSEKCGGSTRTRIARGALGKIKLLLPPLSEQNAIAQVLSDMDAEIDELEKKLVKYRLIKQGMMQELLTGKTRLV